MKEQKQKKDFKKLPIIEQERIKLEIKNKKNNGILYIEDAIKNESLKIYFEFSSEVYRFHVLISMAHNVENKKKTIKRT